MTRHELNKELSELEDAIWEVLKEQGWNFRIPHNSDVEEFAIYVILGIKPSFVR